LPYNEYKKLMELMSKHSPKNYGEQHTFSDMQNKMIRSNGPVSM
jgi:hypothetical protein